MQYLLDYILIINLFSYLIMCADKLKSIYQYWRISEKILWICAIIGGVFGIWLGMYWPMYHKAGKRDFRLWIPIIGIIWICILLNFII
ncbi:DUF1294 domain-containing protein [Candidatus Gracilibacteria bacterium]|nr:DUF1294 domain-containing protein [Candidatus Gracilibacteria bacterium]